MTEESLSDFVKCYNPENIEDRQETYTKKNQNGRFRKYTLKEIKENGYKLDLKWLSDDDDDDDRSIAELMEDLKEKSKNIATAVNELEVLLKDL